jgi:hypothetical protein
MVASMISVLIRVKHGPEALAATLSALVPAVAAGLVGDAVIITAQPDDAIVAVAEASGATLVVTADRMWHRGAVSARKEWMLCLEDGDIPQEGWIRVLDRFITFGAAEHRPARMKRKAGPFQAVVDRTRAFCGLSNISPGDLVHRQILAGSQRRHSPIRLSARIERDPAFS